MKCANIIDLILWVIIPVLVLTGCAAVVMHAQAEKRREWVNNRRPVDRERIVA